MLKQSWIFMFLGLCAFTDCNNQALDALNHKEEMAQEPVIFDQEPDANSPSFRRESIDSESASVVTDSNIFSPERKFEAEAQTANVTPTAAPSKVKTELPDLKLVGTLIINEKDAVAYISDKKNKESQGKPLKYKLGDTLGEYSLIEIKSEKILLKKGEEVAALRLKPSSGSKAGPATKTKSGTEGGMPAQRQERKQTAGGRQNNPNPMEAKDFDNAKPAEKAQLEDREKREAKEAMAKEAMAAEFQSQAAEPMQGNGDASQAQTWVCGR